MKSVLVIDDDEQLRRMIREMLETQGYRTVVAPNGREGFRLLCLEPADLVITDIYMPEKEGLETIRELKRNWPAIKIIAISGGSNLLNDYPTLTLAKKLGATCTLEKPFSYGELLSLVMSCMKE